MAISEPIADYPPDYIHPALMENKRAEKIPKRILALKTWRDEVNLKLVVSIENKQGSEIDRLYLLI